MEEQFPTAGALGTEGGVKGAKRFRSDERMKPNRLEETANAPSKTFVPPAYNPSPLAPKYNLAGRADSLARSEGGIQDTTVKTINAFKTGDLNNESYFHFQVRSNKHEWISFSRDSVTLVIYGQVKNAAPAQQAGATAEARAEWHALRSQQASPSIALDPDVAGTGFFHRVDVSINGVPVPTTGAIGNLLLQSIRINRIFGKQDRPKHHFNKASQYVWPAGGAAMSEVMKKATAPFDYSTWDSRTGFRIPVYLDGIIPFDFKCHLLESVDNLPEPNLVFGPDTEIDIKLHTHRNKIEAIFMPEVTMANYFSQDDIDNPQKECTFTFQQASLTYESELMHPANHTQAINDYVRGGMGIYEYDIMRGQHQSMPSGSSYVEHKFHIPPWCRMWVMLFLPDHAVFPQEAKKRPLSGFTRFPRYSSRISLGYAGREGIIAESFENLGYPGVQHTIGMKNLYDYYKSKRLLSQDFDDLFPKDATDTSLIQAFIYDCRTCLSSKTELLHFKCWFGSGHESPAGQQVCVISIHPNGRAVCTSPAPMIWNWKFEQNV